MDSEGGVLMCWIVTTRFCVGIWLNDPLQLKLPWTKNAKIEECFNYQEALERLQSRTEVDLKKMLPNKLVKVKDDKIYHVFYNRKRVGFVEYTRLEEFYDKNHMKPEYYRTKRYLTYREAVAFVTSLSPDTGKSKILARNMPQCGRLYKRKYVRVLKGGKQ